MYKIGRYKKKRNSVIKKSCLTFSILNLALSMPISKIKNKIPKILMSSVLIFKVWVILYTEIENIINNKKSNKPRPSTNRPVAPPKENNPNVIREIVSRLSLIYS